MIVQNFIKNEKGRSKKSAFPTVYLLFPICSLLVLHILHTIINFYNFYCHDKFNCFKKRSAIKY